MVSLRLMTHFTFGGHNYILAMAEVTAVKFCTQMVYIKSYQINEHHPQKRVVMVT